MIKPAPRIDAESALRLDRTVDLVSGGLLLVWTGLLMLLHTSWGTGLAGVGLILLGEQAVRWRYGLDADLFWVLAGVLLLGGSAALLTGLGQALVATLLLALGVLLLFAAFQGRRRPS